MRNPLVVCLQLGLLAMLASPAPTFAGTEAEYRALQQWCIGRDKWTEEGRKTPYPHPDVYNHFHHYCMAMKWMNQSFKVRSTQDRRHAYANVHGNLGYVLTRAPAGHPLLPELYAMKGRAYVLEGKRAEGESTLSRALQLDPGHVEANATLARLYAESNRKEKAKDLVRRGLAAAPDNKSLLRLAKDVGIPESEIKAAVEEATVKAAEKAAPDVEQRDAAGEPAQTNAADPVANPTSAGNSDQPKIGSPTNPYCRFCPD